MIIVVAVIGLACLVWPDVILSLAFMALAGFAMWLVR
jgi:hypothetical protein